LITEFLINFGQFKYYLIELVDTVNGVIFDDGTPFEEQFLPIFSFGVFVRLERRVALNVVKILDF
jgi:hypothetical protein